MEKFSTKDVISLKLHNRSFYGETIYTKVKAHTNTKSSKGSMSTAN